MGVSPPGPARAEKKNLCQKKSLAEKNSRAGKNSRAEKKKACQKNGRAEKKKVCQRKLTSSGIVKKKHDDTNWAPYWTVVISVMPKFSGKSSFLD